MRTTHRPLSYPRGYTAAEHRRALDELAAGLEALEPCRVCGHVHDPLDATDTCLRRESAADRDDRQYHERAESGGAA